MFVPSIKYKRPVPSIYTKQETVSLLNCVDRTTDIGIRSYALIVLALRLGLRTGDIVGLKISDVDFTKKEISFYQEKTQVHQRLELVPEVDEALSEYISKARPHSEIPNLFLSLDEPYKPVTQGIVYYSINKHIKEAGIEPGERKSGAHSLRMTLASELVAENVPYNVVRKILGHENPVTIKHYVKFDIAALRSCALSVPPITGKLAEYMIVRTGGQ
jgi:integrase